MKKAFLAGAAALMALHAAPALAAPEDFADVVDNADRLDQNRAQDEARQPAVILDFAGIERGAVVADFLAGSGYFSTMLAQVVGPEGRVYGMNPPGFHNAETWEGLTAKRKNLRAIVAPMTHQQIAPSSVDTIFTHMTFHDLYWESEQFNYPRLDVPAVLANWHAGLKEGGTVIVVDHHGPEGDTRDVVARLHRIDRDAVIAAMSAAGFELVGESDALHRSNDDLNVLVFDPSVQGKTSRFMLKFKKM